MWGVFFLRSEFTTSDAMTKNEIVALFVYYVSNIQEGCNIPQRENIRYCSHMTHLYYYYIIKCNQVRRLIEFQDGVLNIYIYERTNYQDELLNGTVRGLAVYWSIIMNLGAGFDIIVQYFDSERFGFLVNSLI